MTNDFQTPFSGPYETHLKHFKFKRLQPKTNDACARDIRRLGEYFDYRIDALPETQLTAYFSDLIGTLSWSDSAGAEGWRHRRYPPAGTCVRCQGQPGVWYRCRKRRCRYRAASGKRIAIPNFCFPTASPV